MKKHLQNIKNACNRWVSWNPPGIMSADGHASFNSEFSRKAPIRYWLTNTLPAKLQPILFILNDMKMWVRYRTVNRMHVLRSGLEPGYHDLDELMLHTCFTMLVDFVEVESAHMYIVCNDDEQKKESRWAKYLPFYKFMFPFRRPDLGIAHITWSTTLDDPALPTHLQSHAQAVSAREILALYNWWTVTRQNRVPLRPTEFNDQGLGGLSFLSTYFDSTAPDFVKYRESVGKMNEQESIFNDEDQTMFIRLINIRRALWT